MKTHSNAFRNANASASSGEVYLLINMLTLAARDARKGSEDARAWLDSDSRSFLSAHWCVDSIHRMTGSGPTLEAIRRRL